jgi:YidC/Oxa1 family membrane protein insertase
MSPDEEQRNRMIEQRQMQDSIRVAQALNPPSETEILPTVTPEAQAEIATGGVFTSSVTDTLLYTVSTPYYTAVFTNVGAGPASIQLTQYAKWDGTPVQMISDTTRSAYSLGFISTQNYNIETRSLVFSQSTPGNAITLGEGETTTLEYVFEPEPGKRLVYTYRLNAESYDFDLDVRFEGAQSFLSDRNLELSFVPRLNSTEKSRASEGTFKSAYISMAGELEQVIRSESGREDKTFNGETDWIASKTKFFAQIIKPDVKGTGGVIISELTGDATNEQTQHTYATTLRWRLGDENTASFHLYMGPLEYSKITAFETEAYDMVDVGYSWINWFSKPFVKFLILPVLTNLNLWLGNMGLAIIVFSILIKVILHYPTKKSFESMAAMRELQPEMKLIQEKYKEDPKKQQEATMALFKKAKVNPLGGCLPNLLQLPVLLTLWRFFSNAIEIRGEAFLWAPDLSAPDVIINLPFSIPFLGDHIAGFVLLMTASMVWQMKISGQGGAANPQMKMFTYVLPVMLLFMFNNFASGLSLYYLLYNLLSIGQQYMINKKVDHTKLMAEIEGTPKKTKKTGKTKQN